MKKKNEDLHTRFMTDRGLAVVLGSGLACGTGLSGFGRSVKYSDIPGLTVPSVEGHPGRLFSPGGDLLLFAGRSHLYEGPRSGGNGTIVSFASRMGCSSILLTQAAGSLRQDIEPGSLVLAGDIVSMPVPGHLSRGKDATAGSGTPLISGELREMVREAALRAGVPVRDGVLFWTPGPNYETPAEARMALEMGADAATMSPLPELSEARTLGLRAACLSWITNQTANVSGVRTEHGEVVGMGRKGSRMIMSIAREVARLHREGISTSAP